MRAVIVAAVSTGAQAIEEKASIPQQLEACRATCQQRAWEVVEEVVIEGHSRAYTWLDELCTDCPQYARLMRLVRSGTIALVVVRDYDRLWRSDSLRAQVVAVCAENRVQVFSLNQPLEPTPAGQLAMLSDSRLMVEAMSGIVSQMENTARKRRHRMGMVNRTRRGLHPNSAPYGYKREDDQMMVIPERAHWVRWMYERRAEGWGYKSIRDQLNALGVASSRGGLWTYSPIRRILNKPFYAGMVTWGDVTHAGVHEPIVSVDLWERVQSINQRRASWKQKPNLRALTGLVTCGYCGWRMAYVGGRDRHYVYLRCNKYLHYGGRQCQSNTHHAKAIEAFVLEAVQTAADDPAAFLAARAKEQEADISMALITIQSALRDRRAAKRRWERLVDAGAIPYEEIVSQFHRIEGQISQLEAQEVELERREGERKRVGQALGDMHEYIELLPTLAPHELRASYAELIDAVELCKEEPPRIRWL